MRKIGNALEFVFVKFFLNKRFKPNDTKTCLKVKKLEKDFDAIFTKQDLVLFLEKLNSFFRDNYDSLKHIYDGRQSLFKLNDDNQGVVGDTSDMVIITSRDVIPISIKYNNDSIKHNRPECLWRQMNMTTCDASRFKKNYSDIISDWKHSHKVRGNKLFGDLDDSIKSLIISKVNNLTYNWLLKYYKTNRERFNKFISFILGKQDCLVIKWSTVKQQFMLISKNELCNKYRNKYHNTIVTRDRHIFVRLDKNNTLMMRLHTCSSTIFTGEKVNLKYDCKIVKIS